MNREKSTLVETLTVLSRHLRHVISEIYADHLGLNESAVALLRALSDAEPGCESPPKWTQSKLAQELSLSESSLCTLIERLRRENFLDRERLVTDRRKTHIRLTEKGSRAVDEILRLEKEFEERFWKHLSDSEYVVVSAVLENVIEACDKCHLDSDADRRAA